MSGIGSMTGEVVSMEASLANAAAPLGATSPAFADAPVAKTVETDSMTVNLPSSAFKKLKDESIEKGKKKAFAEFEAKAKAAGFDSFDEMFSLATAQKTAPVTTRAPAKAQTEATVPPPPKKTGDSAVDRDRDRFYREKLKLQSKLDREGLRRRELQRELDAREAEMLLRESAAMSGVRDIDYAIRLLEREISGKDETALSDFDERAFFGQLRGSHPYLFGETVVPATTGLANASAPAAPRPNTVTQQVSASQQVDARKMNRQEYEAHLRSRGLAVSSP